MDNTHPDSYSCSSRADATVMKKHDTEKAKSKVFVVDDHPLVRKGLGELINQEADLVICGEAESVSQALERIEECRCDIAIVDLSLKEASGIELIKDIRVRWPDLPVLVLSIHDESFYAERVLRAGARGYITKDEGTDLVLTAIRRVLSGEVYLSQRVTSRMLSKLVQRPTEEVGISIDLLSDRELEVFESLGNGMGTRQIAEKLHLSAKTVETHRENIKRKLKLANASELLQHAIQWVQSEKAR